MRVDKLGLVSISFRKNSVIEILEAMKKAGLFYIEWGSDVHAPCDDIDKLKEIAILQKEFGITCSSYGTYFRLGENKLEDLQGYIDAAKILGTNILRLWCGTKSAFDMSDDEKANLFEECKAAESIARQNGVILCMECHKRTFTEGCDDVVSLMKYINSENFKMYWQPFQWQSTDQNIENAKKIAPYTQNIHVFNWENQNKFPLDQAHDTWRAYLENFPRPRTLLLEFMPNNTLEELTFEANTLKKIVGEM